jgi:hypothetical protein
MIELFKALAKAQLEFKPAEMDRVNPHYKSKYASLASVQEVYRKPLSDNGLSIIQNIHFIDNSYHLETILAHSSGESIKNSFKLLVGKQDMQGLGSAITYARRYAISAMLGIVSDEDDDANESLPPKQMPIAKKPITNNAPRPKPQPKLEPAQDDLDAFIGHSFLDELVKFTKDYMIPAEVVTEAIERITGEPRKASTLSDEQLNEVMNYLALKYV